MVALYVLEFVGVEWSFLFVPLRTLHRGKGPRYLLYARKDERQSCRGLLWSKATPLLCIS
jgi:hypothetical protein